MSAYNHNNSHQGEGAVDKFKSAVGLEKREPTVGERVDETTGLNNYNNSHQDKGPVDKFKSAVGLEKREPTVGERIDETTGEKQPLSKKIGGYVEGGKKNTGEAFDSAKHAVGLGKHEPTTGKYGDGGVHTATNAPYGDEQRHGVHNATNAPYGNEQSHGLHNTTTTSYGNEQSHGMHNATDATYGNEQRHAPAFGDFPETREPTVGERAHETTGEKKPLSKKIGGFVEDRKHNVGDAIGKVKHAVGADKKSHSHAHSDQQQGGIVG